MVKRYKFGKKMPRKSWKPEEIDKEREDKRIIVVFAGLFVMFALLALFMWWAKHIGH